MGENKNSDRRRRFDPWKVDEQVFTPPPLREILNEPVKEKISIEEEVVAKHPETPEKILKELLKNENPEVSEAARKNLAQRKLHKE